MVANPPSSSTAPSAAPSGTPLSILILVMVVVIAPLIVLAEIIAYWRVDVVDDQMFAYYGWRIAHGATMYLDVWDNKPPGIYWINALAMAIGGGRTTTIFVFCGLALAIAHVAFFLAARCVYHRSAAALATLLLGFFLPHAYFTGGTNRTETFLVMFELIGVALYLSGYRRDRWWLWYLAGVSCGIAFLFKQVGLAAWGCMGLHLILLATMRDLPVRTALRRAVLLLGGLLTTLTLVTVVLLIRGNFEATCFATFGFNAAYMTSGDTHFPYNGVNRRLLERHLDPSMHLPLLMAFTAIVHATLWWLRPAHRPADVQPHLRDNRPRVPRYMALFVMWYLVAAYGAVLSPHAFRHYVVPTIPPLIMIGGYLIHMLRGEQKLLRRFEQRAWVLATFVALAYFAWDAPRTQFQEVSRVWIFRIDPYLNHVGEYQPAEWETVGAAVANLTTPDDRIQCFEYLPGVYLHARRINATRYTTTEKVGQIGPAANYIARHIIARLKADPPAAVVMGAQFYHGLWTGESTKEACVFHPLAGWLRANYGLAREIPQHGTYYIFKRNDLPHAHAAPWPEL